MRINTPTGQVAVGVGVGVGALVAWWAWRRAAANQLPTKWEEVGVVSKLNVYPLKSGRPVSVSEADATEQGLSADGALDRSFLVMKKDGPLLTGRQVPKLTRVTISFEGHKVTFESPDNPAGPIEVDLELVAKEAKVVELVVFGANAKGLDCGDEVAAWMSQAVSAGETPVRLLYNGEDPLTQRCARRAPYYNFKHIRDSDKQISGVFDVYLRDYGQKEPHDFLGVTLGWLHSDLARTSNDLNRTSDAMSSVISDNFHIQHLNVITCEKRQQPIVIKIVSHSNLTLAVCSSKGVDLETLLTNYYTPQYIQWDCDLCGSNHKCRQETIILRLPPFLIIHLSRYNVQNPHAPKVGVQFPETLDCMKKFCGFNNDRKYSIYGICAHEGTMKFGHCISVCRQSKQGQASEEGCAGWHLCNDNTVLPKEDHSVIGNENAHILFYEAL